MPSTDGVTFYVKGKVANTETFAAKSGKNQLRSTAILYRTSRGMQMLSGICLEQNVPAGHGEGAEVVAEVQVTIRNGQLSSWYNRIQVVTPAPVAAAEDNAWLDAQVADAEGELVSAGVNGKSS